MLVGLMFSYVEAKSIALPLPLPCPQASHTVNHPINERSGQNRAHAFVFTFWHAGHHRALDGLRGSLLFCLKNDGRLDRFP